MFLCLFFFGNLLHYLLNPYNTIHKQYLYCSLYVFLYLHYRVDFWAIYLSKLFAFIFIKTNWKIKQQVRRRKFVNYRSKNSVNSLEDICQTCQHCLKQILTQINKIKKKTFNLHKINSMNGFVCRSVRWAVSFIFQRPLLPYS